MLSFEKIKSVVTKIKLKWMVTKIGLFLALSTVVNLSARKAQSAPPQPFPAATMDMDQARQAPMRVFSPGAAPMRVSSPQLGPSSRFPREPASLYDQSHQPPQSVFLAPGTWVCLPQGVFLAPDTWMDFLQGGFISPGTWTFFS